MHTNTSIVAAVVALGLLAAAPLDGQTGRNRPKTMEPEVIIGDSKLLRTNFNLADARVTDYLQQSMLAIQQGHRAGFQHFRVWFRDMQNAKKSASVGIAQEIMSQVLPGMFKLIFPGSGEMLGIIESVVKGTLAVGEKVLDMPEGNVELFLDRLQAAEEERIARLLDAPKQLKAEYPDQYNAAVWEYLEMRLLDPAALRDDAGGRRTEDSAKDPRQAALPASVVSMLDTLGVPSPGAETARRVAEGVLASHIHTVMRRCRVAEHVALLRA